MSKDFHLSKYTSDTFFFSMCGIEIIFCSHKFFSTLFSTELVLYDESNVPLCTLTSLKLIQDVKCWLDSLQSLTLPSPRGLC